MKVQPRFKNMRRWGLLIIGSLLGLLNPSQSEPVEGASLGGPSHIGTFEGSTTFTTSSSNGINPGLYLEVMDKYGNYTEYTSEDGIITIPGTQEGAYVTQAKLLGKTKYRDQDTGELLDQWEAGRKLTLESVQRPVLTTTGKNLFDNRFTTISNYDDQLYSKVDLNKIIGKNGDFTVSISQELNSKDKIWFNLYINGTLKANLITNGTTQGRSYNFLLNEQNQVEFGLYCEGISKQQALEIIKNDYKIQIEEGSVATSYEPYKSNILTVNEEVELGSVGDVKDELNLLTGELTQRTREVAYSNDMKISLYTPKENSFYLIFGDKLTSAERLIIADKIPHTSNWGSFINNPNLSCYSLANTYLYITIPSVGTVDEAKQYLSNLNPIFRYVLATESVKTVGLNSTYSFQPVMNREVYISGNILPLVCSVTIPTEPLTFVLNPNAEADQQFIAPEFTITNHTPTSIYLELSRFEQLTQVLTDVLPEAHEDWSQLDRAKSKEIALALVPKPSEGWLALEEGPRYVAEDSNYYLGEVKANSSVDFTFTAHHGRAFVEALNPQYRLSFVFDFFDR